MKNNENLVAENEQKYGEEIRAKYGDDAVDRSNTKVKNMTSEQYAEAEALRQEMMDILTKAFKQGDPASQLAQKACNLHRQWLMFFYDGYCKEYHIGLAEMYVADERFKEHYDNIAPGAAEFLRDAIKIYCGDRI